MQLPGVQEVQHKLDHLRLLEAYGLVCRHDNRSAVAAYSWLENRQERMDGHEEKMQKPLVHHLNEFHPKNYRDLTDASISDIIG